MFEQINHIAEQYSQGLITKDEAISLMFVAMYDERAKNLTF